MAAVSCPGQTSSAPQNTIVVHVIKARNGKPLHGYHVWLQSSVAGQHWQPLNQKTGSDGIAAFTLDAAAPEKIMVSLGMDEAACSGIAQVDTHELQTQGVSIGSDCGLTETTRRIVPKPGEIIFFVRPMPLWARILAPLERE